MIATCNNFFLELQSGMEKKNTFKKNLNSFIHKHVLKTEDTKEIPHTFKEELNRQSRKYMFFAILIVMFAWLPYISTDMQIYPDMPWIQYLRWGLSLVGLIMFILQFFPGPRSHARILLWITGLYLMNATAFITAMTHADPNYMAGFIFILMIIIVIPLLMIESLALLITALLTFFITLFFQKVTFNNPRIIYSLKDLFSTTAVIIAFITILNGQRVRTYLKSRELQREKSNLSLKNKNMEQELSMARLIQEKLIPEFAPIPQINTLYKPMEMVGGDFYDFIKFRDPHKVGIFLSDVSGHGVPAAFITSMIKSFLLQAGDIRNNPAHLLQYLNEMLNDQTGNHFITAIYGIFDTETREFYYSNAGHNPPFVIHKNNLRELYYDKKSMPLAILNNLEMKSVNKEYMNHTVKLKRDSRLLLYTDGLTEAISKDDINKDFYEELKLFLKNANKQQSNDIMQDLYWNLVGFHGSEDFQDDICVILIDVL